MKWRTTLRRRAATAPEFVRSRAGLGDAAPVFSNAEILVEVGAACVRVARGFDVELLRAVVDALFTGACAMIPIGIEIFVALEPALSASAGLCVSACLRRSARDEADRLQRVCRPIAR